MTAYILKRLLLIIPTLLGVLLLNFIIVQSAPGGPVEQIIAQLQGHGQDSLTAASGGAGLDQAAQSSDAGLYRGAQGLDPEWIAELNAYYGFDRPAHERFFSMLWQYMQLDFGESFYRDQTVLDLILDKLPVSISLGLWTTLLTYLISIPLGIRKAVRDGSRFDVWSSLVIVVGYAIPSFLLAILLILLFAGGSVWSIFPLQGLVSDHWADLSTWGKIKDYLWHITLPVIAMTLGGFASLTMLTKNSFLDEISKQYVTTAYAKGLSENQVLYGHVFRNAMLIVIAGFPAAFIGIFFTGSLLIEVVFSLDGLGLLGYESALSRDYPVMFATLFIFTLFGLLMQLVGDLMYRWVDPRIDFSGQGQRL